MLCENSSSSKALFLSGGGAEVHTPGNHPPCPLGQQREQVPPHLSGDSLQEQQGCREAAQPAQCLGQACPAVGRVVSPSSGQKGGPQKYYGKGANRIWGAVWPQKPAEAVPPFLPPYLGPSLNLRRRPRTLQTQLKWVRIDRGPLEAGGMDTSHPVSRKELGSPTPKSIALCLAQSSSSHL